MTTHQAPHSVNLKLRRARQVLRLSQAQFAEVIRAAGEAIGEPNGCTKRLVQKWESGEHRVCKPAYLVVLETVTGLSAAELGMRAPRVAPWPPGTDRPDGGAGAQAGSAQAYTSTSTMGMAGEAIGRLRHALDYPATVNARCAEFAAIATGRLFELEHHTPARLLVGTVERHLGLVTTLLDVARHAKVRSALTVQCGAVALLCGQLAADRGIGLRAHEYFDAATGAAQATTDEGLLAAALTFQAESAARHGDPATAWQLAATAARYAAGDPRAAAWVATRIAHHAALMGEHADARNAILRALAIGRTLPDLQPDTGMTAPWTRSFNRARLLSACAHTAALLGDPAALDYATEAVDALSPAKVKSRAIVLAEAAITAAITGELELCLDYGSAAAALTRDLEVTAAADLLHDVARRLLPHARTPVVRELLPQLTHLLPTEPDTPPAERASAAAPASAQPAQNAG